ncbi:hypothetical protein YC2023_045501 [Brassica napus]
MESDNSENISEEKEQDQRENESFTEADTQFQQTLAVMNGLGRNPQRLPPVLPPTQTRINGTLEQDLNFGTLLGASHSLVNR